MVSPAGLNTTLSIVDAAASLLKNDTAQGAVKRAVGVAGRAQHTGSALTSWTSQTTILSRMYVDESLLGEPVLPHVSKNLHEWYAAQVIAALQLTQMVDDFRTVNDVMSVVQTGHNQRQRGFVGNIASRRVGQETFLENYHGKNFSSADLGLESFAFEALPYGPPPPRPTDGKAYRDWVKENHDNEDRARKLADNADDRAQAKADRDAERNRKFMQRDVNIKSVKTSENRIGPMGELYEIKLSNPRGDGVSVTVPVFVQMQPSIVPAEIAPRFVDMNVPLPTWQRWTMFRAGEMTFFKDFIFHADYARKKKALLKDPAAAKAFSEYLATISNKDKYALGDVTDSLNSRQSANLANSVMILSEDAVAQAKIDSGIDLHNPQMRNTYFKNTYTMILVIVDPLHQRVTTFFNGLDGEINASYNDYRPNSKDYDPNAFMTALQAFSSGQIGRMR
jgi:hypothetical protein